MSLLPVSQIYEALFKGFLIPPGDLIVRGSEAHRAACSPDRNIMCIHGWIPARRLSMPVGPLSNVWLGHPRSSAVLSSSVLAYQGSKLDVNTAASPYRVCTSGARCPIFHWLKGLRSVHPISNVPLGAFFKRYPVPHFHVAIRGNGQSSWLLYAFVLIVKTIVE